MLHLSDSNAVVHSDQISKLIDMEITLYVVSKIRQTSTLKPVISYQPYINTICSVETNIEHASLRHIEHWRKGNIFVQKGLP